MFNALLNNADAWIYIIIILSIVSYSIRSMFNKWQDRKIKEAESRVKVAELELKKQRESPKFATYAEDNRPYEEGLMPLIQE